MGPIDLHLHLGHLADAFVQSDVHLLEEKIDPFQISPVLHVDLVCVGSFHQNHCVSYVSRTDFTNLIRLK